MAMSGLRAGLQRFMTKYPLAYNMGTVGTLYTMGDISQHTVTGTPYDWGNTARIAAIGVGFFGPVYFYWYRVLDRVLPGTAPRTIVKKLLADQLISSSFCTAGFFIGMSILEQKKDIFAEMKEKFVATYTVSCMFWPLIQTINFWKVPPRFRATYVGSAAFVWTNILCFIKSKKITTDEKLSD